MIDLTLYFTFIAAGITISLIELLLSPITDKETFERFKSLLKTIFKK